MQLLPHGMQELLRIRSAGLLPAFILPSNSAFTRRDNSARHVLQRRCCQSPVGVIGSTGEVSHKVFHGSNFNSCACALGLSLTPIASAASSEDIGTVQKSLSDKGYDAGPVDGVPAPRTRASIRQCQASEKLTVTGRLDAETVGKLGVGPESIGGSFEGAGQEVKQSGKELGTGE